MQQQLVQYPYTAHDLAQAFKVAPKTIREHAALGRIDGAQRVGRLWRFTADAKYRAPTERPEVQVPATVRSESALARARTFDVSSL